MSTAPTSPTGPVIDRDVLCMSCGYNLRGLTMEKVCPECGISVGQSLLGDRLEFSDPAWLRWQRRGVFAFLFASIGTIVYNIVMFWLPLDHYLPPSHREWLRPVWFFEERISPFVMLFAAFCLRIRESGPTKGSTGRFIIRHVLVAAVLSHAVLLPVFWDFRLQGLWTTNSMAISKAMIVWMLVLILRGFARRSGKATFGRILVSYAVIDSAMILLNAGLISYRRFNSLRPFPTPPIYRDLFMTWEFGRAIPMVLSVFILYRASRLLLPSPKSVVVTPPRHGSDSPL